YTRSFERSSDYEERRALQLQSLMMIANHEQITILQPLIYNEWVFNKSLDIQAALEDLPLIPKRVAAFTTTCDIDNEQRRVKMKDGNLYETDDRMMIVTAIAEKYHIIMHEDVEYMEGTFRPISSWSNVE